MKNLIIYSVAALALLQGCKSSNSKAESSPETTKVESNSNTHDYKRTPPGGLAVKNVPQFIVIGADDCGDAEMVRWIMNYVNSKTNPKGSGNKATFDGLPIKMSFYVNGKYSEDAGAAWKEAYLAGNEIGNHTYSHFLDSSDESIDARLLGREPWAKEIAQNDTAIINATGISKDEIVGFRVPRLEFNREAFLAMTDRGFLYECSIEEGGEDGMDGTNNYWPYTLDNGSQADSLQTSESVGENDWGYKEVGKIANLWELPVYNFVVPADSLSGSYSFDKGLRSRVHNSFDYFDTATGFITGFDYNIFAPANWDGAAMKANEYLATLKHSLDLHLKGNRAPFTYGMHPDFYAKEANEDYKSAGDHLSRRKVVQDFIDYALTKPNVRFVTSKQLIDWMINPIGLDGTKGAN